jgi:cell division protein FtsI/penicillin-binding protein 2
MGQSLNIVFARLAIEHLTPGQMARTAEAFGFNKPLDFDVPVQPSRLDLPDDDLGFARTAAGFWNSTLSPVHGLLIASAVAKSGRGLRPSLVDTIRDPQGRVVYRAPATPTYTHRVMGSATARALRGMMETTVSQGTAREVFLDRGGRPYLPNIRIAAKTGTLTRARTREFFTWFVGFAPANNPQIAFATVVVDDPAWHTKAPTFTRELLRAYFASRKAPGVTRPI